MTSTSLFSIQSGKKEPKIEKSEPLRKELEHFLYCIDNHKEPLVNGEEALKTLDVAIKATRRKAK